MRFGQKLILVFTVVLVACAQQATKPDTKDESSTTQPSTTEQTEPVTEPETKSTETASVPQVPSIIFLQYLNQQAPTLFCVQDPSIKCMNMPTDLCMASVQDSITRCGPTLLEQWPASFEEKKENAVRYAQEYRLCILQDWVTEFGVEERRMAACGIVLNNNTPE